MPCRAVPWNNDNRDYALLNRLSVQYPLPNLKARLGCWNGFMALVASYE